MEENLRWKATFDGKPPLIEDDPWWKTTFDGRWFLMEDALWWIMAFDGRQTLMEDDLWWKMIFNARWPVMRMRDGLWWEMAFDGRQLLVEHNLQLKTTLDERRSSIIDNLRCRTTFGGRKQSFWTGRLPKLEFDNKDQVLLNSFFQYLQICNQYLRKFLKQVGAELGQAQVNLELELSLTWFKICCIKLINKKNKLELSRAKLSSSWIWTLF